MIDAIISVISNSFEIGAIYGIVVLGLVISFRIIGFADLTMESSFTTGASVAAIMIGSGTPPVIALFIGSLGGALAGCGTAFLHVRGGINKLLSGIIMMTMLYSVNLRIMGKSNYSLLQSASIFDYVGEQKLKLILVLGIAITLGILLWWFLNTQFGYFMRATGENPRVVTKLGKNTGFFVFCGLMVSNSFIAFAGALAAQNQGFSDVNMGMGLIISSLASLIIGEAIIQPKSVTRLVIAASGGAIIYQLIISTGLRLGISPWDLKIATGALLAVSVIARKKTQSKESNLNIGCEAL